MNSVISRRRLLGASSLGLLSALHAQFASAAPAQAPMPVLAVGHGSPANALKDNPFTQTLTQWGKDLPRPKAILMVSAHWLTPGEILVNTAQRQPTIHDFSGFSPALHAFQYPAPGAPEVASQTASLLKTAGAPALGTTQWGLDHGSWSALKWLYPAADVPVFQLSIDYSQPARFHYLVGKELAALRRHGVLIVGSGNIVHNLGATERGWPEGDKASRAWAHDFDAYCKEALDARNDGALLDFHLQGSAVLSR